MHEVKYTERAIIELNSIYNYIYYNLANPIVAIRFREQIPKSISNLKYFPYMGKKLFNSNFRYLIFKNYLIFYSVSNQNVEIQRIIHKSQNLKIWLINKFKYTKTKKYAILLTENKIT